MLPAGGLGQSLHGAKKPIRLSVIAATSLSLTLASRDGTPLVVDWGDGAVSVCTSNGSVSHTYGSAYTGYVSVTTTSELTRFNSASSGWSFDVSRISRVDYINVGGAATGNLSSIPRATTVNILGTTTVGGDLSSIPCATTVNIFGSNTVGGDLSSIPLAATVHISGSNTVGGDLSSIPLAGYIELSGSNTVTFSGSWTKTTMRMVYVRGANNIDTAVIDSLLNALADTATTWTNERIVNLKGTRSFASDAAVATLQGRGVSVNVS